MIDAAEAACDFMAGRSRADLDSDRMLLFAVVRAIEVLGEAAARMSEETRHATPHIPWNAIVGMRNRLIHGYFNIDVTIVWKTVSVEIPSLLAKLRAIGA
jgi:uncharacterized protein with HEPN domain